MTSWCSTHLLPETGRKVPLDSDFAVCVLGVESSGLAIPYFWLVSPQFSLFVRITADRRIHKYVVTFGGGGWGVLLNWAKFQELQWLLLHSQKVFMLLFHCLVVGMFNFQNNWHTYFCRVSPDQSWPDRPVTCTGFGFLGSLSFFPFRKWSNVHKIKKTTHEGRYLGSVF